MDGGALEFILSRFIIKLEGIIGTIDETTSLMNNTEKNIAQACYFSPSFIKKEDTPRIGMYTLFLLIDELPCVNLLQCPRHMHVVCMLYVGVQVTRNETH